MPLLQPSAATVRSFALLNVAVASDIFTVAPPKPTLAELLLSAPTPWTLGLLAVTLGVDPVLFDRVQAKRQPLPRVLARRVAELAGLQVGDVEAVVELCTNNSESAYRPLPADRALGDALDFQPLARMLEITPV